MVINNALELTLEDLETIISKTDKVLFSNDINLII